MNCKKHIHTGPKAYQFFSSMCLLHARQMKYMINPHVMENRVSHQSVRGLVFKSPFFVQSQSGMQCLSDREEGARNGYEVDIFDCALNPDIAKTP